MVFKALLTLHQMIRSGSTDQLLDHLAASDILRLRNIGGQSFEGKSVVGWEGEQGQGSY